MRLWSLHPSYLDQKGLVALWREALLARAVLRGKTRGYKNHPQLRRFLETSAPISAINQYLTTVHREASSRGYSFDKSKIGPVRRKIKIPVTQGQLEFELQHLRRKIESRAPGEVQRLPCHSSIRAHSTFSVKKGQIEDWEKGAG